MSIKKASSSQKDTTRPFQYCWEFNAKRGSTQVECQKCIVYRSRTRRCYEIGQLPADIGHAKFFCTKTCEQCEYFQLVRWQSQNVLVVTDQDELQSGLETSADKYDFNMRFSDCEYKCSMLVEKFRPDYVVVDCSMGAERARQLARGISADPRIPFARIILVGKRDDFPTTCDKEVFANIERPFTAAVFDDLMRTLEKSVARDVLVGQ